MVCTVCISCQKAVRPDTPHGAVWLMKTAVDEGDYQRFQAMFTEARKNAISAEMFQEMREETTAEMGFAQYGVLTFDNGEMMLIRLTPEKIEGEYKIEDVVIIPDDMKALFDENEDR